MGIVIQLDQFEGPLDLLLYLIRKEEMDIFDINIQQITRQYFSYIQRMREFDLELAGEFVAMAASLIQIKSQMLLPEYNESGEVAEGADPRKPLVQKLFEYQKFKEAAGQLGARALLGRDLWARGEPEKFDDEPQTSELILEENPLFSLISCYRLVVKRLSKSVHKVSANLQSVSARILEIRHSLRVGQTAIFSQLITATEGRSSQVLITFLSLLELAKMGFVHVFQNETYGEIYVETKHAVDRDVISQVEGFDGTQAGEVADRLFADAEEDRAAGSPELHVVATLGENPAATPAATDEDILAEERKLMDDEESQGESSPV